MWKHIKQLIAPVVASLLVVGVANSAMYQWSKTASSNATADSTINWSDGQSPSSINDSARALMARVAEWRDDISGSLTGAGTSTAYTLTTNQGLPNPPTTGQMISFVPNVTNGAGVTLAVDGGTAYAIRQDTSTAVSAGTLIAGTPYTMMFNGTYWLLRDFYVNTSVTNNLVPIGAMIPYFGSTVPNSNFVFPYGQCISRTTYSAFFALVSTTYGVCDGTTTFGVPDLRGRVVAGLDNMGGSAASRLTATYFGTSASVIGATGGLESHTLTKAQIPTGLFTLTDSGHTHGLHVNGPPGSYGAGAFGYGFGASTPTFGGAQPNSYGLTDSATTGITLNDQAGGGAHPNVQPTMVVPMILRIL